jgi:hypothetical protein
MLKLLSNPALPQKLCPKASPGLPSVGCVLALPACLPGAWLGVGLGHAGRVRLPLLSLWIRTVGCFCACLARTAVKMGHRTNQGHIQILLGGQHPGGEGTAHLHTPAWVLHFCLSGAGGGGGGGGAKTWLWLAFQAGLANPLLLLDFYPTPFMPGRGGMPPLKGAWRLGQTASLVDIRYSVPGFLHYLYLLPLE